MRFKIARVWLMWLLGMAVLAGVMWVLFMFPLPGGSSGLPTLEEVLELVEQLGVSGTITILAIVFLPPILLNTSRSGGHGALAASHPRPSQLERRNAG